MTTTLTLGPFSLERILGQGGMGEVWLGRHLASQWPVAIKVITAHRDRAMPERREAFIREVHAQAAMDHDGILRVFDHGQISASLHIQSQGQLVEDSPYLVMELADAGSLEQRPARSWPELRQVLISVLEALAHAHARGMIHLDLKPANVLCHRGSPGQPLTYKLGDFGIAFAMNGRRDGASSGRLRESTIMGTPAYMAPEQILGQWRAFGPWTDLYALGCMTWELLHDRAPFQAPSLMGLAMAHLNAAPPVYSPLLAAPAGLEAWLLRLLAKAPHARFERAAHALDALLSMDASFTSPASGRDAAPAAPRHAQAAAQAAAQGLTMTTRPLALSTPSSPIQDTLDHAPALDADHPWLQVPARAPEGPSLIDVTWLDASDSPAADAAQRAAGALRGVGLGLWGLRSPPLVGRLAQRRLLWQALASVAQQRQARLVMIEAEPGQGKSRLLDWLEQAAHERGVALTLRATSHDVPGPWDGLRGMLATSLRVFDSPAHEAYDLIHEHLRAWLGLTDPTALRDHAAALTALVVQAHEDQTLEGPLEQQPPRVRFSSEQERHYALCAALRLMADRRPTLVLIEGLHHSQESLAFLAQAIEELADSPLLFVATLERARVAALGGDARSLEALEALAAHERAQTLTLAPLSPGEHRQLIGHLLGLSDELAARVQALTQGQPMFAVQLVHDWVERGLLRPGPMGFELEGASQADDAMMPPSLAALCHERLAHQIAAQDGELAQRDAWIALELAAALGQEVSAQEWSEVCALARVQPAPGLIGGLVVHGLARRVESGWMFVNQLFVQALERHARQANRWTSHHLRCAQALQGRYEQQRSWALLERAGLHWLQAQQHQAALDALLQVIPLVSGARAQQLIEQAERALQQAPPTPERARQVARLQLLGRVPWLMHAGKLDQARARFDRVDASGLDGELRVQVWLVEAQLSLYEQRYARVHALVQLALDQLLTPQADAWEGAAALGARAWRLRGSASHFDGHPEQALAPLERAVALAGQHGERWHQAWARYDLASCLVDLGRYAEADAHLIQVERDMIALGDRVGASYAQGVAAVSLYDQGRYEQALEAFLRAEQSQASMGSGSVWLTRENYARCLIKLGRYDQALPVAQRIKQARQRARQGVYTNFVGDAILSCLAGLQDWRAFEAYYPEAMRELDEFAQRDEILVEALQETLTLSCRSQRPDLIQPLGQLILSLCQELDLPERAAATLAILARALTPA